MTIEEQSPDVDANVTRCARHPSVETVLRCGRCETPICPKCMVATPVGARCRTCAGVKRVATVGKPLELARAFLLALLAAEVGALLLLLLPVFLIGHAVVGFSVGWVVSRAVRGNRGRDLAILAVVAFLAGQVLAPSVLAVATGRQFSVAPILAYPFFLIGNPLQIVALALGGFLAWTRAR
ncbi:MAG: B-box zinc finger protein [Chloroflexi bacterium]|nr:B-box zinc finger protein [Chloroflexota bacterium]